MRLAQPLIRTDVQSGCDLANRRFRGRHFSLLRERTRNLHAEIDIHSLPAARGMVIKENIVPVAAKPRMLRQKLPDLIESRPPGSTNLADTNPAPNGCQRSSRNSLDGNIDGHDRCRFSLTETARINGVEPPQFPVGDPSSLAYNCFMQISLEPSLEARLKQIASEAGKAANQVVEELVANYIDHDAWFKQEVNKGLASLDAGKSVSQDDVRRQIDRIVAS
jgi:predicted transcriptional regulator